MKFCGAALESLIRPSAFGLQAELETSGVSNLGMVVAGELAPPSTTDHTFAFTASNSSVTAFSGAGVSRLTSTFTAQAMMNAGSSS